MTPGRAALVGLMHRYLTGLLDPFISLLEVHKLMYFAQEAGEAMTIIGLVAAGLGVSVLPASYQRIRIDGVVYRTLLDPEAVTAVWLVQRKDQQSPMAKAFVELLTRKALV